MALNVKALQFAKATSAGEQDITTVGFQPKCILLFQGRATSDGTQSRGELSVGAAVSTSQLFTCAHILDDAAGNADSWHNSSDTCTAYIRGQAVPVILDRADFVEWLSNGFTLDWNTTSGSARDINVLALGGSHLEEVAIKQFTTKTSTGTQDVTGVGFQPNAIIFVSCMGTSAPTAMMADAQMMMGYTDGSNDSACHTKAEANGSDFTIGAIHDNSCLLEYDEQDESIILRASLNSWLSDGFQLNYASAAGTARYVWAICLKVSDSHFVKVGTDTTKTSTGTKDFTVGHKSIGALLNSVAISSINDSEYHDSFSAGMFDKNGGDYSKRVGAADGFYDISEQQQSSVGLGTKEFYIDPGFSYETTTSEFDAQQPDGFTLDFLTASSTAFQFMWMSFAEVEALAGSVDAESEITGHFHAVIKLAGSVDAQSGVAGALSATVPLAGSVDAQSSVAGALSAALSLAGSVDAQSNIAGVLSAVVPLAGSVDAQSSIAGALSAAVPLAGSVDAQSSIAGALSAAFSLAGSMDAQSSIAGVLSAAVSLAGSVDAQSAITGHIHSVAHFAVAVDAQSSVAGALNVAHSLAGSVDAQSSVAGALSATVPLAGSVDAQSNVAGALSAVVPLSGSVDAQSSLSGALFVGVPLVGSVNAQSSVTGTLSAVVPLAGSVDAQSSVLGLLSTIVQPDGSVELFIMQRLDRVLELKRHDTLFQIKRGRNDR